MVRAINAVPPCGEEDRMRHAGIVPLLRIVHELHAEGRVGAGRGGKAGGAGRDAPAITHPAVDRHGHGLGRLVDLDENVGGERRLTSGAGEAEHEQRDGDKPEALHPR